ncbi:uncharacterized protein F4807DRAFT_405994 [Annulohypoxylon truncatum]|uniref:uncharacterized protein n=1 Tax=Annulohypoxylon truncatum TaxID=327061 RepID=UPI0020077DB7|nr:uncharacterized protein F4807DRAFT_405994 [Annulohypoxylon truncatum]KAI1215119.1 hypothetical protein F4807DRAFT_405994 [Annulohypoxylon truncatum]
MAKERADKPRKEKGEKADKSSRDKVKKHKKEKKVKHDDDIEMNDAGDEPGKVEVSPAKSSGSSVDITLDSVVKPKKAKKEKKSKKAAEEPKTTTSFNDMSLPLRPASKDSKDLDSDGGAPLFAIDTNPTPVNLDSLTTAEKKDGKPQPKGYNPPPSGLNRQTRRRIRLIEQQREKFRKKLGVPEGSSEKQDEVQAKLDAWVADFDGKAEIRMKNKRQRREKNAAKVRNKRGKILTGERLKTRQKEMRKVEKKSKKHGGISVTNEA